MESNDNTLDQARATSSTRLLYFAAGGLALLLAIATTVVVGNRWVGAGDERAAVPLALDPCRTEGLAEDPSRCPERQMYLDAQRTLHQDIRPQLELLSAAQWTPDGWQEVHDLEADALVNFTAGDYQQAAAVISQALYRGRALITLAPQLVAADLQQMQAAFIEGDATTAQDALDRVRVIEPENEIAQRYAPRIEVLSAISQLLAQAQVAEVENRPAEQIKALREIVSLDPIRKAGLQPRINELANLLRERQYRQQIARAEAAVDSDDLTRARQHVERARLLAPRRDLSFLTDRIEAREKQRALALALDHARQAQLNDDWQTAQGAYRRALGLDPTNGKAVAGLDLSERVIERQATLNSYAAKPIRLTSARAAQAAGDDIALSQPLLQHSPRLGEIAADIQKYLAKAEVPVSVAVLSNGKTEVQVRRVGVVGTHTRKVIQLKPGTYQFEGRRRGYKSQVVTLEIPFDVAQVEVRVESNERI